MPGPCAPASAATRMPTWPPWNSKRASQLCRPSFFGVVITHVSRASSAIGASLLSWGAGRDDTTVEELRIPVAETYGVAFSEAAGRLIVWCKQPETELYCTDTYARRLLA